ncbi:MAG: hypothetical protein IT324_01260 [Anaerolineae bacterium]|nr:hypothetical protein [Anaerolineae bacterium]
MATLQSARQSSSYIAKARLKQVCQHPIESKSALDSDQADDVVEDPPFFGIPAPAATAPKVEPAIDRLAELEQRQLMLQTVAIYKGWQLVSLQHRPESGVLIASLVRSSDNSDPVQAMREGRVLQIVMDAVGDMKVQHPRREARAFWLRRLQRLFRFAAA